MEATQIRGLCKFDMLFTKYVPHILENIFFSLDCESYKTCLEVSNTWRELLTSKSYKKKAKSVFECKQNIVADLADLRVLSTALLNGNPRSGLKNNMCIHIVEIMLISSDYEAYNACLEVSTTWRELLTIRIIPREGKICLS